MVDQRLFIPLSPPSSPRMSAYHSAESDSDWQDQQTKLQDPTNDTMALVDTSIPAFELDMSRLPMLRSHKTFPYTLRTSGTTMHQPNTPENSSGPSPNPQADQSESNNLDDLRVNELPTVTFGGSAPASPISNLTPTSEKGEKLEGAQDLNGLDIAADEDIDIEEDDSERPPMTAAELRAHKRKMKRFRLTHNQTRFLMSEFARQAHPDAAHRERLAREIPGLSPRQVQVWFQNRRAKLKRLTSDDRERVMRSRALPDDFDMTQALHSPFGSTTHTMGTPLTSPSNYTPAFPEGNMIRPLNLESLRRVSESSQISPTGITPAFGSFNFTPPQSVPETLSPVSNHESSPTFNYSPVDHGSPRRSNPFVGSAPGYPSHPQIPRLQLNDRMGRQRSESLSSPLRTSMSYSGGELTGTSDDNHQPLHSAPPNGGQQPSQRHDGNNVMPYGLGYNYSSIPGFQTSSRMRSYSNGMPRRIELHTSDHNHVSVSRTSSYSPHLTAGPQTATFPNSHYIQSPMAVPQHYAGLMSAPHHITSFHNSYLRNDGMPSCTSATGDVFPNVIGEVGNGNADGEDGDSRDTTGLGIHTDSEWKKWD